MSRLEVPATSDLAVLAPLVRTAVEAVLADMALGGFKAKVFETVRTPERQEFLFGKGRTPEQCLEVGVPAVYGWPTCPDGKVTKAPMNGFSWHGFGLAADIVENDATPWTASQAFWHCLGDSATKHGLIWGGSWARFPDLPHVQWARAPQSPTENDRLLLKDSGMQAIWRRYGAA